MEDRAIVALYWKRAETAILETKKQYGRLLFSISRGILRNEEDAEECENDTYLRAWDTIPPKRPEKLSAFLAKITRNLSLDRYDAMHAEKRGGGEVPLLLDELAEVIADETAFPTDTEGLSEVLNAFLGRLKPDARTIFLRRYWFGDSVQEISARSGFGESKIKMSLLRTRQSLKEVLEKEGYRV
ncbi:RNA polymerase sigma factor [Stomatobaculum longum]|uniref:RNA polymerase sigma factor n=1 Tax=Stomatobaculum longum TaxID=796942 RepID=UPI00280491D3|nr:RNA polymerase sigma factor [Stomatobaculum longum]